MNTEQALLRAINRSPDEDTPRLAYADWLDENGQQPERAEYIRKQIEAVRENEPTKRKIAEEWANTLMKKHRVEWERPFRELGDIEVHFARGFPNSLSVVETGRLIASQILDQYPVSHVKITGLRSTDIPQLVEHLNRTSVTSLDVSGNELGPEGVRHIAGMSNLTSLDVGLNDLGPEGAEHIAGMKNLTSLNVRVNELGPEGVRRIAGMKNLTSLNVSGNNLGPEAAQHIAGMHNLTALNVSMNELGPEGVRHIAGMKNLTSLNVSMNSLSEEALRRIVATSSLASTLVTLNGKPFIPALWQERVQPTNGTNFPPY